MPLFLPNVPRRVNDLLWGVAQAPLWTAIEHLSNEIADRSIELWSGEPIILKNGDLQLTTCAVWSLDDMGLEFASWLALSMLSIAIHDTLEHVKTDGTAFILDGLESRDEVLRPEDKVGTTRSTCPAFQVLEIGDGHALACPAKLFGIEVGGLLSHDLES